MLFRMGPLKQKLSFRSLMSRQHYSVIRIQPLASRSMSTIQNVTLHSFTGHQCRLECLGPWQSEHMDGESLQQGAPEPRLYMVKYKTERARYHAAPAPILLSFRLVSEYNKTRNKNIISSLERSERKEMDAGSTLVKRRSS